MSQWSEGRGTLGPTLVNHSFNSATLDSRFVTANSTGTSVDTNSGAGYLRIKTTGTALSGYNDYGRAYLYLPGALDFEIYVEVTCNTTLEQYADILLRSSDPSAGTATGAPDVSANCYDFEIGNTSSGSWINQADGGTLTQTVASEGTLPQPNQFVATKMRIVCYGELIRTKAWIANSSSTGEPINWMINYINRNHFLARGREWLGLGAIGGSANGMDYQFANLKVNRLYLGRNWSNRRLAFIPTGGGASTATEQDGAFTLAANSEAVIIAVTEASPTAAFSALAESPSAKATETQPSVSLAANADAPSASVTEQQPTVALAASAESPSSKATENQPTVSLAANNEGVGLTEQIPSVGITGNNDTSGIGGSESSPTAALTANAETVAFKATEQSASIGFTAFDETANTSQPGSATEIDAAFSLSGNSEAPKSTAPEGAPLAAAAAFASNAATSGQEALPSLGATALPSTPRSAAQGSTAALALAALDSTPGYGRIEQSPSVAFGAFNSQAQITSPEQLCLISFTAYDESNGVPVIIHIRRSIGGSVVDSQTVGVIVQSDSVDGNVLNTTIGVGVSQ